MPKADTFPHLL